MELEHVGMHQQNYSPFDIEKDADSEQFRQDNLNIANSIQRQFKKLLSSSIAPECNIYRVSNRLVAINHAAYMPQVVSIGPFHYGREHLKAMEWHKLQCLYIYLRRLNMNVEAAVEIVQVLETSARSCYAEPTNYMNKIDFVKMMLVDGCFMMEFMILVHHRFRQTTNGYVSEGKAKHLVDFLSSYCVPSYHTIYKDGIAFLHPPTLTALHEAGVSILKATNKPLMDISFKDGVLNIPPFKIYDNFETYVRNIMAFEQFRLRSGPGNVTKYIAFLDGLISTEKDASLLVKAGILTNNIGGSDEEIAKLFNNLCKEVTIPGGDEYYYDLANNLHDYCKKRWPKWKATLRREYFNTPWTLISVVAAAFLILLTILQTLFSALSITNIK